MTSQLKVDRISPATGSEVVIDGGIDAKGNITGGSHLIPNNSASAFGVSGLSRMEVWDTETKQLSFYAGSTLVSTFQSGGNAAFMGNVSAPNITRNGYPVIDAKGLIDTLVTLRNATLDETQDIRESLRSAIDELVEGFEQAIAEEGVETTADLEAN